MGFFDKLKGGAEYAVNYSQDKMQKTKDEYEESQKRATNMTDAELKRRYNNSGSLGDRCAMAAEYKKRHQSE